MHTPPAFARSARTGFLLLAIVAVVLAWPALKGALLSDDIAIIHWLLDWEQKRGLWTTIAAKFGEGLDVPSHYYRPLALVSYGIDARLSGWSPLAWHATTFALHLINSALVMRIALHLHGDAPRALAAAAIFVFFPLSAEVSIWSAGRYDALALTGMLIAVYGHLRASGYDRWRWLSLAGFVLGLTAKEAAMTTPGLLVLASFLRSDVGELWLDRCLRTLRENIGAVVIFFAYLGFRYALFGSALQVYPNTDPGHAIGPAEIIERLWALTIIPRAVFAPAPWLGALCLSVSLVCLAAAAITAWRARRFADTWLLPLAWCALSLLALVPHLEHVMRTGEGGRFYYATGAWFALCAAGAVGLWRGRAQVVVLVLIAGSFAIVQRPLLNAWRDAGAAMHALVPELERVANSLPEDAFALVMVPDHLGPVPFARNAQGGIVLPPLQSKPLLPKLVPFLPHAIAQWPSRIEGGLVAQLKSDPNAKPRLDAAFCYDADHHQLIRAEITPDWRNPDTFEAEWRNFVTNSPCASLLN
jgi:hypothetical protein